MYLITKLNETTGLESRKKSWRTMSSLSASSRKDIYPAWCCLATTSGQAKAGDDALFPLNHVHAKKKKRTCWEKDNHQFKKRKKRNSQTIPLCQHARGSAMALSFQLILWMNEWMNVNLVLINTGDIPVYCVYKITIAWGTRETVRSVHRYSLRGSCKVSYRGVSHLYFFFKILCSSLAWM